MKQPLILILGLLAWLFAKPSLQAQDISSVEHQITEKIAQELCGCINVLFEGLSEDAKMDFIQSLIKDEVTGASGLEKLPEERLLASMDVFTRLVEQTFPLLACVEQIQAGDAFVEAGLDVERLLDFPEQLTETMGRQLNCTFAQGLMVHFVYKKRETPTLEAED